MATIILPTTNAEAKQLSRCSKLGQLRRVYHGIYTDDLDEPIEQIVQANWMLIVGHIVTEGILSFATAIDLKPAAYKGQSIIFMTSTYTKTLTLPGLTIKVSQGDNKHYIEQVLPELAKANIPRALLENLSTVRSAGLKAIKTIGEQGVERYLANELNLRGEAALNKIRDQAQEIAQVLDWHKEYKKLSAIISALLATHPDDDILKTRYAKAIIQRKPFDAARIKLFEDLAVYLKKCRFLERGYTYQKTTFKNLTFYESYFSNFIEGTEFLIDEAEDIVFKGIEVNHRHADSHDVLANFVLSNDFNEMNSTPQSADELVTILQSRHAYLMKERSEKSPGQFKTKPNKAGNTYFVLPDEVLGTLAQGFAYYHVLNDGMEKALFMHFLISEVHPFDDGNGRLARIMMNAELVRAGLCKIIIPSVHRDNYLNGLRLATRDHDFRIYCKSIDQAQAYTASVNWIDYGEAREKIEHDACNVTPDEGLPTFNRALRELALSNMGT